MCITEKESIMGFGVMLGVSIALFIRNGKYDRILAALFVVVSLIQLVEYRFHAGLSSSQNSGKALFVILLLQLAVLGTGIYLYFRTTATLIWAAIFLFIFGLGLFEVSKSNFSVTRVNNHLSWSKIENGKNVNILGKYRFLYLIGLFLPFFIIQYYSGWKDTRVWIILLSLVLATAAIKYVYNDNNFASMWCYSAVAVVFTAWLVGAFPRVD